MSTDKEQKKLERLLKLKTDSELAIFDEVQEVKDEIEQLRNEIPNLDAVLNSVKGQKGETGEPGKDADEEYIIKSVLAQIRAPKDGKTPSKSELLALIRPLIPVVRDGKDGLNGLDADEEYIISEVLRRLPKPKDGKDGAPDTPEQIVNKLQTIKSPWLDAKSIKNLPQPVVNNYQSFIGRGGGASVGLETIKSSGTIVKQGASTLEFDSTFSVTPTVNGAIISAIGDGTGDVHGPASSTDEAIARFDGTTGKIIQNYTSGAPTISDTGAVTIPLTTGNSLVVDTDTFVVDATNNRVGIKTTTPGNALSIGAVSSDLSGAVSSSGISIRTGGTIGLGVENPHSSSSSAGAFIALYSNDGAAMASGDRLGGFLFGGSSSASSLRNTALIGAFASELWVDATNYGTRLAFETTADGSTSRTEKMTLTGAGRLGIGTTAPSSALHVVVNATDQSLIQRLHSSGTARQGFVISSTNSSNIQTAYVGGERTNNISAQDGDIVFGARNNNTLAEVARITGPGLMGIGTTAPTHTLTLPSTSTGIALYNTADQTTNYERVLMQWSTNIFAIKAEKGGTGTLREIRLLSHGSLKIFGSASSNGDFAFDGSTSGAGSSNIKTITNFTSSSGISTELNLATTITQSGTAGYNILLINPTESSTGSGVKRLISAQVGSVDKFVVDNAGNTTATTFNPATKQTYNIKNVTTDRAYDANATTLDEVADTLGTLIADLRAIGLVS